MPSSIRKWCWLAPALLLFAVVTVLAERPGDAQAAAPGDLAWAKRAGGSSIDTGRGIAVDASGNSYVTGSFRGSATFGPGETNATTLTSAGIFDIFVAKYDASGDLVWATRAGGTGTDVGNGIALDDAGNSFKCHGFFRWFGDLWRGGDERNHPHQCGRC